jgi:NitT/TauT family transport system substrate-binding protein
LLAVVVLCLSACTDPAPPKTAPSGAAAGEPLRICTGTSYSVLVAIAAQEGLFAREGVQVSLLPYVIGRDAMEAMLNGKCDLATSADTPVADYGRKRDDLRIVAGIAKSDRLCYIVARKDSGIRQPRDLQGRSIGVVRGTAPHYFLDLVLNKNRLTGKDVRLRYKHGEELRGALLSGEVAAIATTDLNALKLQEELGDTVVLLNDPGISLNHGYLTLLEPTLQARQDAILRVLRALRTAEQQTQAEPEKVKALFAAYCKVSPWVASQILSSGTPGLSLEPAMILTLEDNARWLHEWDTGTGEHKSFKEIIRPELLRQVAPASVTLR